MFTCVLNACIVEIRRFIARFDRPVPYGLCKKEVPVWMTHNRWRKKSAPNLTENPKIYKMWHQDCIDVVRG
jgi:hypothetical protein